jgi:SagB-type dehydrogenase family enzyme
MSPTSTARSHDELVRFRCDVVIDEIAAGAAGEGVLRLLSPVGSFALRRVAPAVVRALRALSGASPASVHQLSGDMSDGEAGQLRTIIERVANLLVRCVHLDGRVLAGVEATARDAHYEPASVALEVPLRLSKFALLRTHGGALILESPLAKHRMVLLDPAAVSLVASLGAKHTGSALAGELPTRAVRTLLGHLVGAGFVEAAEQGSFPSDTEPALRQWDLHDLLIHSRARGGRFDQPFGGIFPYRGEIEPRPALKPLPAGRQIPLHRPALDALLARDPALTTALEGRTSIRHYGEQPLTAEQIGEFLYRTARVRALYGPSKATPYEATTRPYPCGGAAYELELYLTVRRCQGIEPGAYYYDPAGHRLILVNEDATDREAMLHTASVATGLQAVPDVLITMTSRFQRLSWKYRAIAYSVSLKDAGVLYQTMYLVATAMGLAPCGLGSGDADLACRVLGLDYLAESSVGDFLLGSLPTLPEGAPPKPLPNAWRPINDPGWGAAAHTALRERHRGAA